MTILAVPVTAPDVPGWIRFAANAINALIAQRPIARSTVSATYTLEDDYDVIPVDTTGGAFTVTLTPASKNKGRVVYFKRINAGANNLTIDGDGSETIDGAASITMTAQWETRALYSDGANWLLL